MDSLVLLLVGDGSLRNMLEWNVAKMRDFHIKILGSVPEGDDYAWIATTYSNLHAGAVGIVINQSTALGTPTIIANVLGPDTKILFHGNTEWRFQRGNSEELVSLIEYLLDSTSEVAIVAHKKKRGKTWR